MDQSCHDTRWSKPPGTVLPVCSIPSSPPRLRMSKVPPAGPSPPSSAVWCEPDWNLWWSRLLGQFTVRPLVWKDMGESFVTGCRVHWEIAYPGFQEPRKHSPARKWAPQPFLGLSLAASYLTEFQILASSFGDFAMTCTLPHELLDIFLGVASHRELQWVWFKMRMLKNKSWVLINNKTYLL